MAKCRIIGVLAVRNGRLVKSYGYSAWRPAGDLLSALRNLDEWGADEIVVLDISRRPSLDPSVLAQIQASKLSTPLAYGGGIRAEEDFRQLMEVGCDRFVLETVAFDNPSLITRFSNIVGAQALILALPIQIKDGMAWVWRPESGIPWEDLSSTVLGLPVSEFIVMSVDSDGIEGRFPYQLLSVCGGLPKQSVIWFGGLDLKSSLKCFQNPLTAAVAFGNRLHDSELDLPLIRRYSLNADADVREFRLS